MTSRLLQTVPGLLYGYSVRADGSMQVQTRTDLSRPERVAFLHTLGFTPDSTAGVNGVHKTEVRQVLTEEKRPLFFDQVDGLFTLDTSRLLTVTGADCFPIYVVDPETRVTGLCHAGWRGTAAGILPALLKQMTTKLSASADRLLVVIGPGIHVCHFEVKTDVRSQIPEKYHFKKDEKTFIDLPRILLDQALEFGISADRVEDVGICTACDPTYYSYRRDKTEPLSVQMAYLGWKL